MTTFDAPDSATPHLWEVDHPYYCNEGNYYSNDTVTEYKSWAEFIASEGDSDMDYNLVFRWDWCATNDDGDQMTPEQHAAFDDNYRGYTFKVFWMGQRKGLYRCTTAEVCRSDEPAVIEFLQPRLAHLLTLWEPLVPRAEVTNNTGSPDGLQIGT